MKFTNVSDDARNIPTLGITVEPGATTPELTPDESAGFDGQAEVWAAVADAKAATQTAAPAADVPAAPVADEGKA